MSSRRNLVLAAFGLAAVWALLFAHGCYLHWLCGAAEPNALGWVSISGFDSEGYLDVFRHISSLFTVKARHPLFNLIASPVYFIAPQLYEKFGAHAANVAILVLFSAIGAVNVGLLAYLTRSLFAVALWLVFAHTWVVGALPETFGLSTTCLLVTLVCVRRGVSGVRVWTALAVVTGGVTLTNGAKVVLAALVALRSRRAALKMLAVLSGLVLLAVPCLIGKWVLIDRISVANGFAWTLGDAMACTERAMDALTRLRTLWEAFYLEPMMRHGGYVGVDFVPFGYSTVLPHVVGAVLLAGATASAWINRRDPVVRALLLMLSVDVAIHFFCGWGIAEAQIYSAHWLFALPVLLGLLLRGRRQD